AIVPWLAASSVISSSDNGVASFFCTSASKISSSKSRVFFKSGKLTISENGNIVLVNEAEIAIWSSSNVSLTSVKNTVAQLLDDGNFVLRDENDENSENYIWQSFDHPTDTLLPGMKLGLDRKTGENRFLKSWKASDDPGEGEYSFKMDTDGFPEILLWKNVTEQYRSGPWNGRRFSGVPEMKSANNLIEFEFLNDSDEISYSFDMLNDSVYSRLIMTTSGILRRYTWIETSQMWSEYWFAPRDKCDFYGECGPYGICDMNSSPGCKCLKGFVPKNKPAWDLRDGSDGCVRTSKLDCESDVGLFDMRQYAVSEGGQDLYVRAAASDLDPSSPTTQASRKGSGNQTVMIAAITSGVCAYERSQDFLMKEGIIVPSKKEYSGDRTDDEIELPLFDFPTLVMVTNNFSNANKLGQGGFGSVYKGTFMEGEVVAIKRLSRTSGQGIEELKNEVRLIAKLQHRNLVRLLGCCIEVEEKLLVYEYMENKSLNTFLFDKAKSAQLDWQRRFNIISGIARGLLYLHQDSRFRIIHRDLKASNILLDKEMTPKISDFGMARIFGSDQTEAETKKVVGTQRGIMVDHTRREGVVWRINNHDRVGMQVKAVIDVFLVKFFEKKKRGFFI
nr:receptor-like serine/threonine-protein kinase SD1-8 [Tanacetum cinerariifolium]